MWSRVWQVACREEEVPNVGDYVEYTIGDESVIIVRSAPDTITALPNACLHRGTRLADGAGHVDDGSFRCPFHGWRYALDGRVVEVVDAEDFDGIPDDLALCSVRAERWGGFVFVNFDADAEPLLDFLDPLPKLFDPYHFDQMKFRSLPHHGDTGELEGGRRRVQRGVPRADRTRAGAAVDRRREHRLRDPREPRALRPPTGARRKLQPSPRLGLTDDEFDAGEVLAGMVTNLGGAFLTTKRRSSPSYVPPISPTRNCWRRSRTGGGSCLASRGFDVSGLEPDQMTSADDVYLFPNMVGPVFPGSTILFRVRPGRPRSRPRDHGHMGARVAQSRAGMDHARRATSTPTGTSATGARSPRRTTRTSAGCSSG